MNPGKQGDNIPITVSGWDGADHAEAYTKKETALQDQMKIWTCMPSVLGLM